MLFKIMTGKDNKDKQKLMVAEGLRIRGHKIIGIVHKNNLGDPRKNILTQ